MLASPSPAIERESIEEDYSTPPTDLVDSAIPNSIPRDVVEMGQERKPAWV